MRAARCVLAALLMRSGICCANHLQLLWQAVLPLDLTPGSAGTVQRLRPGVPLQMFGQVFTHVFVALIFFQIIMAALLAIKGSFSAILVCILPGSCML